MDNATCAITGHRPDRFAFGYDEADGRCLELKKKMAWMIAELILRGVNTFYTGMALGADQWAAEIVLDFKERDESIKLVAVLPCMTQADRWPPENQKRYADILAQCDEVITLQSSYTAGCMLARNRYLVDHAAHLLALYDGEGKGGTAYTVQYAKRRKLNVTIIHPDTLEVTKSN